MATPRRAAPADVPLISGAQPWQRPSWLPTDVGPPWLTRLAEKHRAAAADFAIAVEQLGRLSEEGSDEAVEHRRAVRTALLAGETPPAPPDPALVQAKVEVAREDVDLAERTLSELAVEAIGQLRQHREELAEFLPSFSDDALKTMLVGGGSAAGRKAIVVEQVRREARRLDRLRGFSENVDTDPEAGAPLNERISYAS